MALSFRKFWEGIRLVAKAATSSTTKGDLEVLNSDSKIYYHNGTVNSPLLTEAGTATLTGKTIDADLNTIINIENADIKVGAAIDAAKIADGSVSNAEFQYLDGVTSPIQTQLNATASAAALQAHLDDAIDAHDASAISVSAISGLTATEVQAALAEHQVEIENTYNDLGAHITDAIDAHDASAISSIPSGNLAATEVQAALNELQSDIDTRSVAITAKDEGSNLTTTMSSINFVGTNVTATNIGNDVTVTVAGGDVFGPASATDEAIARFDGTTGKLIQNSVVTITDAGVAAGFTGITSSGTVSSTGTLAINGNLTESLTTDAAATGANATITNPATSFLRLTNASLTSIDMLSSPVNGEVITIENATGASVTINNDTGGTAANRFLTGTKAPLNLADEASIIVKYDATEARWMVIGGTGAGGGGEAGCFIGLDASEALSTWSTGDNATFLGAGALSGTFVKETAAPLNGLASYKYTQAAGSVDDYLASPAQPVALRFRGQDVTLSFPYTYNGANNDIQVIFYCATTASIIPSSVFIQASTGVSIFKTNITIPLACTSLRIGFQTKVLSSGAIFLFDDIEVCSDATAYADIDSFLSKVRAVSNTGTAITATVTDIPFTEVTDSDNSWSGSTFTVKQNGIMTLAGSIRTTAALAGLSISLFKNGVSYAKVSADSGSNSVAPFAFVGEVLVGEVYSIRSTQSGTLLASTDDHYLNIVVSSSNTNILTAPETFSTDTAPLVYAGSATYTDVTLADAPIGTFITFTYAAASNTPTQTNAAAPSQTTADMNINGINIFTRVYANASTSGNPSRLMVQIGKGLKGTTLLAYKSAGKITGGQVDFGYVDSAAQFGLAHKDYNEVTGILVLDAGLNFNAATTTSNQFSFSDLTGQTNAYITINASKNPALTGTSITQTGTLLRITPFTASGTWTKQSDVGYVVVMVQGGGGAGGTGSSPGAGGGGGGGAGGYSEKRILRNTLGATETVTVGAAAGTSSFGAHCSAAGGGAGSASAAGGAGGIGSSGDINLRGGGGVGGGLGAGAWGDGGAGGMSPRFGGSAPSDGSGVGQAGLANSGSGGSGGYSGAGGAGASGVVYVYEYSI